MRKVAVFFVIALAAIGIAFAVTPFHLRGFDSEVWHSTIVGRCSAPVVSAFQSSNEGGWFGYAPLTNTPTHDIVGVPTCRSEGQRRLQYSGMFILAAAVLAIALRRNPATPPVANDTM